MSYRVTEAYVRYSLIDPQLRRADWNQVDHTQVGTEIPVAGYDATPSQGFTDYCLYRTNGEVLAVVEAKRTSREPRVGKQQVLEYVTAIEKKQTFRPFAFMANGEDIFFWDSVDSAERHVAGFFSRENLERLLFLKQNRKPLNSIPIKDSIVNRAYQIEAIRRISEAIEKRKKRKALLVMATGTGKTRTTMALIDVFLQAHAAQRILFLADRDALVEQALTDGFKVHLTDESRTRIRTYNIDKTARVYVSTLQTLEMCYEKFSPADFDLVIADECHRSIYNKFTDVLAYFDGIQIGLTATPAEFIDRDTMKFFDCEGRVPTYLYTFDEAVRERYLADFNVYAAQTKFQRKGIKGVDLTDEDKDSLKSRGIDPDDINYEGTDSIADFGFEIAEWNAFNPKSTIRNPKSQEMYPEYGGKLVQVITSKMERAPSLLGNFKRDDLPRIAISVDMLDTGVDFPEIVNLAFMKPVNSQIKFWQMIGRGTRSQEACKRLEWLPNREKEKFLIVDFWENFEHFNMMPKDGETTGQIPVLVSIFNTRLQKLTIVGTLHATSLQKGDYDRIIKDLRALIARIPEGSYSIKLAMKEVREAWPARRSPDGTILDEGGDDDFWRYITTAKIEFLRMKVAPLLRFVPHVKPAEEFFVSKMERCGLALLQKKDLKTHIESIREDVSLLQTNLDQVRPHVKLIDTVLGSAYWSTLTLGTLDEAKETLAPLMKYRRDSPSIVIELGLDDLQKGSQLMVVSKLKNGMSFRNAFVRNLNCERPEMDAKYIRSSMIRFTSVCVLFGIETLFKNLFSMW